MNIVKQKWKFLNTLSPLAPKQVSRLFNFGLDVLAFRNIQSLRTNARISNFKWSNAKMKMYRLSSNMKIPKIFITIIKVLDIVQEKDVVSVDFSDFGNNFQVLMFAKQTRKGRAIPIYFEILKYPIQKGSQNLFIIRAISNITEIIGFKPKLVFDRGFACPVIVKYLVKNKYIFYLRIKKSKMVVDRKTNKTFSAKDSVQDDLKVVVYCKKIRLITSDKKENTKEPWYLITNDLRKGREKIIKIYYHRFEIEEFFRDTKRLLGLEYVNFQKSLSLKITLWFVIISSWFISNIEEMMSINDKKSRSVMKLSTIRYYFELLHKEIIQIAEGQYMRVGGG